MTWHSLSCVFVIAVVAVTKRHQRLDELLIFLPDTICKISKVVYEKSLSEMRTFITSICCMKQTHLLRVYNKRILCKHDCGHIA